MTKSSQCQGQAEAERNRLELENKQGEKVEAQPWAVLREGTASRSSLSGPAPTPASAASSRADGALPTPLSS